jgi:hypothetical protein
VCPFTGGAYKPTYRTGKWAHSLCCQWIPEVYVTVDNSKATPGPCLSLTNIDKKRFRLRCSLCHSNKGACVQCCYGRCVSAAHPWCLLKNPQGCTRRVVIDPDGDTIWETFCKTHAASVTEPVKPKPKAKMQTPLIVEDSLASLPSAKKEGKQRFSEGGGYTPYKVQATANGRALSMAHALNFQATRLLAPVAPKDAHSDASTSAAPIVLYDETNFSPDDDSDDEDFGKTRKNKMVGRKCTKGPAGGTTTRTPAGSSASAPSAAVGRTFPILNMLEWPGISEGEPMDLDHFWNVISGYHPEDHTAEVRYREKSRSLSIILAYCLVFLFRFTVAGFHDCGFREPNRAVRRAVRAGCRRRQCRRGRGRCEQSRCGQWAGPGQAWRYGKGGLGLPWRCARGGCAVDGPASGQPEGRQQSRG